MLLLGASLCGVESLRVLRIYTSPYRMGTVELAVVWIRRGSFL